MGSDATVAGTNYQASVIAYVFVHVLTETKLRWGGSPTTHPPPTRRKPRSGRAERIIVVAA
jgi:hypothetical protein